MTWAQTLEHSDNLDRKQREKKLYNKSIKWWTYKNSQKKD